MCCEQTPPGYEIDRDEPHLYETQIIFEPRPTSSAYDTFLNYVYGVYALTIAYFTNREMYELAHAYLESRVFNR